MTLLSLAGLYSRKTAASMGVELEAFETNVQNLLSELDRQYREGLSDMRLKDSVF